VAAPSLDDVDVEEVLFRLTTYAHRLFGCFPEPGTEHVLGDGEGGESPNDLAMATFLRFLDPEDHTVEWKASKGGVPTQAGVLAFLKKVLYRDFLDIKRKGAYRACDYLSTISAAFDGDGNGKQERSLDDFASLLETPDLEAIRQLQHERILLHFEQWPDLLEIMRLYLQPEGFRAYTNQALAEILDTTVAEVENRKKRISLRLMKLAKAATAAQVT
jgi:DNA-directed RNA polymerase specialized sigma24 family protein